MINISKLIKDHYITITTKNAHSLGWYIRLKIDPIDDIKSNLYFFRMYKHHQKGNENIHYEFRQYNNSKWGQLSFFIEVSHSIWSHEPDTIVNSYVDTHTKKVDFVLKANLESFILTHEELNSEGKIFQLYFSGSELSIDLENYKEVSL